MITLPLNSRRNRRIDALRIVGLHHFNGLFLFVKDVFVFCRHNELTFVPDKALKTFPNLQTLELFDNSISVLKYNDFRHNKKLKVREFGDGTFSS